MISRSLLLCILPEKYCEKFSINTDFLHKGFLTWTNDSGNKSRVEKLDKIVVVNDATKRGIKLIMEHHTICQKL